MKERSRLSRQGESSIREESAAEGGISGERLRTPQLRTPQPVGLRGQSTRSSPAISFGASSESRAPRGRSRERYLPLHPPASLPLSKAAVERRWQRWAALVIPSQRESLRAEHERRLKLCESSGVKLRRLKKLDWDDPRLTFEEFLGLLKPLIAGGAGTRTGPA